MKIGIHGTGVAGPALAWWLKKYDHEPVLFEQVDHLRTGGYVIDFWGCGFDVAEKMNLLPELFDKGYKMEELRLVDPEGRTKASMDAKAFQAITNNRFISIRRGDIASGIYHACDEVETRFGTSITQLEQTESGVNVVLSNGESETFDLVIGTDGLHSQIRSLAFGPEEEFEKHLGYYVSAFSVKGYPHRDDLTYMSHSIPHKQVARISLRDDMTVFLFIFRSDLLRSDPENEAQIGETLNEIFGDMKWEVTEILEQLEKTSDLYFDRVSQIRMERWSQNRVALLGDAAACVSLLGGEGTGLAMTEAYVLAGELQQSEGDYQKAFLNYEKKLKPFLEGKQKTALRFAGFFAPKSQWSMRMRDFSVNICSVPWLAKLLLGPTLRDDIQLPEYG